MKDTYTKLMLQQHTSPEGDAVFFEKLEKTGKKPRPVWKVAIAVACILLLVPVTVWAAETIFRTTTVIKTSDITVHGEPGIGMQIRYETIKSHPILEFSDHLQTLTENTLIAFDSWAQAEADLGIKLLSNPVLTDENTHRAYDNHWIQEYAGEHCHGYYVGADGQLFYGTIRAVYERNNLTFSVSAKVTADHPAKTEEMLREYHGIHIGYATDWDSQVTTSNIVTKNGIPVTILAIGIGESTSYIALFAVNDISYEIRSIGTDGAWNNDAVYASIVEVLEGFTLE